jgi:hypothetical protein
MSTNNRQLPVPEVCDANARYLFTVFRNAKPTDVYLYKGTNHDTLIFADEYTTEHNTYGSVRLRDFLCVFVPHMLNSTPPLWWQEILALLIEQRIVERIWNELRIVKVNDN